MLVILFGLAGSGKNYIGEIFKKHLNAFFWDADEVLTEEMLDCIKEGRSFTEEMRETYCNLVIEHIDEICLEHEHVVVSQAFYKEKNRQQVLSEHPECFFLQVNVGLPLLQQRLYERNNAVDKNYAAKISSNFEIPEHEFGSIDNNGDEDDIIHQLTDMPELSPMRSLNTTFGHKK
jgi:gluconate kinase